ncbi:ABC transporter substrate-binding protein [Paenibacillus sp. SI8]|uniref:ABC transporter substrate-binding protein n=1 Tax=unclassified Paenibacillus TaxID=185978 RepID=UPI003465122F
MNGRSNRSKKQIWFSAWLVFIFLLTACSSQPAAQTTEKPKDGVESKAKDKESLVIAQSSETRDLTIIDPLQKDISLPRSMVFDTLIERKADGKLVPALADSFETKDNILHLKIRKNVAFHNGDPLTAESVKATLDKILSKDVTTSYKSGFAGVEEIKVIDEFAVDIISKQPNYVLPNFLAEVPVLSAKQLSSGDAYKTQLNGTGPYLLDEWKRGEQVTLKLNTKYWREKPAFGQVVIKNVADESTRIAELLSGKADIASDIPAASVERIKGQKDYHAVSEPGVRVTWLSYNFKAPFDNQKVRQAIYYAIDRKGLAKNLYGDFASPATAPVIKGGAGYVEAYPLSDFNVDKAKKLIAESGVQTPLAIDLDARKVDLDIAQITQAQLKQIGIEAKINTIDAGTFFDPARFEQRKTGSILLSTSFDNPEKESYRLFGTAYSGESFFKRYGYKPLPAADALIKAYIAEPKAEARVEDAKQVLALSKEDASVLWLMHPSNIYGLSNAINWTPDGTGRIDIHQIKVK